MSPTAFQTLCRVGMCATAFLLSALTARSTILNAGPGEDGLRAAIEKAHDGDTVVLRYSDNLTLTSPVRLEKSLTIRYPAEAINTFISGDFEGELFQIAVEGTALENIKLAGSAQTDGLRLEASVVLRDCTLIALRHPVVDSIDLSSTTRKLQLERCTVTGNHNGLICGNLDAKDSLIASNGKAYGAACVGWHVHMEGCTVENNPDDGFACAFGTVKNCIFRFNGGVGLRFDPDPGSFILSGCLFYANSGGGLMLGESATATVDNCTFTRHTGNPAVIIEKSWQIRFRHCTVADNFFIPPASPPQQWKGAFDIDSGVPVELQNCLIADNPVGNNPHASSLSGDWKDGGGNVIGGPAHLGGLTDNGGPLMTLLPLPGSPAIDAGVNSDVMTDARGLSRLAGTAPDAGAVESGAGPAADTDGDGMPDIWEQRYGLDPNKSSDATSDLDGDGQSALSEFLSRTSPADPRSVLRIGNIGIGPTPWTNPASWNVNFRWTGVPGLLYRVQSSTDLLRWQNISGHIEVLAEENGKPVFSFYSEEDSLHIFHRVTVIENLFAP